MKLFVKSKFYSDKIIKENFNTGHEMLFNSYIFIFVFLPITFFIYFYLNSKNLNYQNGKINTTYAKYIGYIQDTVTKSLSDPEYYGRLKQIVSDRHATQASIVVKSENTNSKNTQSVEHYNFFEE